MLNRAKDWQQGRRETDSKDILIVQYTHHNNWLTLVCKGLMGEKVQERVLALCLKWWSTD